MIGSPNPFPTPNPRKAAPPPSGGSQKGLEQGPAIPPQPAQCPRRLVEGPGPRRPQEVVQLPHSRRPVSRQPARRVAAALRRRQRQLQQGLPALRAADGHGVHGPQPLHVAVLRVLHRLHAPLGEVLVVLELVGVVLEDPELRGRLLLHVLGRAVHRLVVVARSFFSVWMPRSTTAMALRSSGRFVRRTAF